MDGSFRLGPFAFFGTDIIYLSKVLNYKGWRFDGFEGGGADGAMKIGIGVDMGGWLISSPMVTSFSSSEAWYEH